MDLLVDNTTSHNLYQAFEKYENDKRLRTADFLNIFHFAEHIMFADSIGVSTYARADVHEITSETIHKLLQLGCVSSNQDGCHVSWVDHSDAEYAAMCKTAADSVIKDIWVMRSPGIKECSSHANQYSQVIQLQKDPPIKPFLTGDVDPGKRAEIAATALAQKGYGSYAYMISTNETLYDLIRQIGITLSADEVEPVALALGTFFKTAINQNMAVDQGKTYSPAPDRANVINKYENLFRHRLVQEIEEKVLEDDYACSLLKKWIEPKLHPLPLLAIHFLNQATFNNPQDLLLVAARLRDDENLKEVRKWLRKWEDDYFKGEEAQDKAMGELSDLVSDLRIDLGKDRIGSIVRPFVKIEADLSLSGGVEMDGLARGLSAVTGRFSQRNIFMTNIVKDFKYNDSIGKNILKMMNCKIEIE
jgi:hypothetical protein